MATSKYPELMAKFAELDKTSGPGPTKLSPAQATKVVKAIIAQVGVSKAFEIKSLSDAAKTAIWTAADIKASMANMTSHEISLKTSAIFRQAKEIEVEGQVLLNQPQDGNRPSKWAIFPVPTVAPKAEEKPAAPARHTSNA